MTTLRRGLVAALLSLTLTATAADLYLVRSPVSPAVREGLEIVERQGPAILVRASADVAADLRREGCTVVPYDPAATLPPTAPRTWTPLTEADPRVQGLVDEVTWSDLAGRIQMLQDIGTRYSFTPQCGVAADSLLAYFAGLGLAAEFHEFDLQGWTLRNVEATQTGTVYPDSIFVICGHYDSISEDPLHDAPGADDNASGTAAVMTAAAILAPHDFAYTIKYLAFSGEEQILKGSQAWVEQASQEGLAIVGALNADMVAWWTEGVDFDLEIEVNHASQWLGAAITDAADLYTAMPYELHVYDGAWWGDHASFWQYGYAAANHEESWDWGDPDFNPYYHSTQDRLEHLSPEFAVGNTRILVAALATLAQIQEPAVAVTGPPAAPALAAVARPNPFNGRVTLQLAAPAAAASATVTVFDARMTMPTPR